MTPNGRSATCEVEECEQVPLVGVGSPVRWVCFEHYEEYLKDTRKVVDRFRELEQ